MLLSVLNSIRDTEGATVELHSLHLYQMIFSFLAVEHEDKFIFIAMIVNEYN